MALDEPKPDDLGEVERRLAGWRPAPEGLDSAAMLYAAGRASAGQRGRWVWPVVAACFALLSVALGSQVAVERSQRLALASRLAEAKTTAAVLDPVASLEPRPVLPHTLLAERRQLDRDFDAWLAGAAPMSEPNPGPPLPTQRMHRAWGTNRAIDP